MALALALAEEARDADEVPIGAVVVRDGALLGVGVALVVLHTTQLTVGSEGVSVGFEVTWGLAVRGGAVACVCGAIAGLLPAWKSARSGIVEALAS